MVSTRYLGRHSHQPRLGESSGGSAVSSARSVATCKGWSRSWSACTRPAASLEVRAMRRAKKGRDTVRGALRKRRLSPSHTLAGPRACDRDCQPADRAPAVPSGRDHRRDGRSPRFHGAADPQGRGVAGAPWCAARDHGKAARTRLLIPRISLHPGGRRAPSKNQSRRMTAFRDDHLGGKKRVTVLILVGRRFHELFAVLDGGDCKFTS